MRSLKRRFGTVLGLGSNPTALAIGLVGASLVVVAIRVMMLRSGYTTASDLSLTELRVRDVPSELPLVGPYSRYGWNHPGPLMFWLMAPVYWLSGRASVALPLATLIVNFLSVVFVLVCARRRRGTVGLILAASMLLVLLHGLGPEIWVSAWNPYIALLPFTAFLFAAWCVAAGDHTMLALMVGAGSFAAAAHVGFLPVTIAVAGTAVVLSFVAHRRDGAPSAGEPAARSLHRYLSLRSVRVAVVVFLVAWSGPIIDTVLHRGGNARELFRYFTSPGERVGSSTAFKVLSSELSTDAQWITGVVRNPFTAEPAALYQQTVPVVAIAVAVLFVLVARRRRQDDLALGVVLIVAVAVAFVSIASIRGTAYDYLAMWALPIGATVMFAIGCFTTSLVAERLRAGLPRSGVRMMGAVCAVALLAGTARNVQAAVRMPNPTDSGATLVRDAAERLARSARYTQSALAFDPITGLGSGLAVFGLRLECERRGLRVAAKAADGFVLGAHRVGANEGATRLRVSLVPNSSDIPVGARAEVVVQLDELTAAERAATDAYRQRFEDIRKRGDLAALSALGRPPKAGMILTILTDPLPTA